MHSIVIGNQAKRTRRAGRQLRLRLFISGCIPGSINSIFYTRTNIVPAIEPMALDAARVVSVGSRGVRPRREPFYKKPGPFKSQPH